MLSRVADALYWMGRYLERTENTTRLLRVTEELATELGGLHEELAATEWQALLAIFPRSDDGPEPDGSGSDGPGSGLGYLQSYLRDPVHPFSVLTSLRRARDNARTVREALTSEVFLTLNEAYRTLEGRPEREMRDLPSCRAVVAATHKELFSIVGAIEHTLTRNQGWLFLKLGESMERTLRAAVVLRAKLPPLLVRTPRADLELRYTRWRSLLRAVSSLENFRQSQGARLEPRDVVHFLLFDPHAPRSLRHGVGVVAGHLERLTPGSALTPPTRAVGKLLARLTYESDDLLGRGEVAVAPFLDHVIEELGTAHEALTSAYFTT